MAGVKTLKITVHDIKGVCPIYRINDTFWIRDGYKLDRAGVLCMHSLSSIMPYYVALSRGIPAQEIGLGSDFAFVQCLDPCEFTGGGSVVFKIEPV
ncbi:hypothetical protein AMJ87_09365 [candidate division WOR_3 bacterium SM23_60]|uniref:TIGR04076 family protein n=1 Tax=candidate division WOR_3 bacterium SM23_60 TaxID=1703780 RepID=A0A0S8GAQ7_UNCW3|nr:MAG: hypothetical protein AMJ87_09365 [candidate division WOR_3 bacterium SM23_60]